MIFHLLKRREWTRALAQGAYAPPSLAAEGFIHCSAAAQLIGTANNFFRGQGDLVVLCIDEERLEAPLKFEAPADAGDPRAAMRFPHLHGPLNCGAVVTVADFPAESDGTFRLPVQLADLIKLVS